MNWITDQLGMSAATQGKIVASFVLVVLLLIGRRLLLRATPRLDETGGGYRFRKLVTYTATVLGLLLLAWIWVEAFESFPTFLAVTSAGVAIALSDVLKNLAGWFYILGKRPLRLGDRIEINGTKGDVVDVRLFRFSVMEVGNWVDADQSTGRLIHIPNGFLFTHELANYTEGFEYIWYEIPVLITFESDRGQARQLIERALDAHAPDVEHAAGPGIRATAQIYHIKIGKLTPIVYLSVKDSGVLLTARFLVGARQQRDVAQAVWASILDGIDAAPQVDLAYPTVRTYLQGPIPLTHGGQVIATEHSVRPEDGSP